MRKTEYFWHWYRNELIEKDEENIECIGINWSNPEIDIVIDSKLLRKKQY